jgi:hypothetical protein
MKVNYRLRLIAILAACAISLALVFPPWVYTFDHNGSYGGHTTKPAGFSCVLSPPAPESPNPFYGVRIDATRLLIECLFILTTSGASWLLLTGGRLREMQSVSRQTTSTPDEGSEATDDRAARARAIAPELRRELPTKTLNWISAVILSATGVVFCAGIGIAISETISRTPTYSLAPPQIGQLVVRLALAAVMCFFVRFYIVCAERHREKRFLKCSVLCAVTTAIVLYCFSDAVNKNSPQNRGFDPSLLVPEPLTNNRPPLGFIGVEVPGVGTIEFPDIMTQDEIRAVLIRKFPPSGSEKPK